MCNVSDTDLCQSVGHNTAQEKILHGMFPGRCDPVLKAIGETVCREK